MILVTGATGFVGRSLVAHLESRAIPHRPVSRLPQQGFHAVGHIDADTDWGAALGGVDTVVHLAARVHVMNDRTTDPLAAFRSVNVDGSLNLARQAVAAGVKRLVFLSSIKVNGEFTDALHPFTEKDEVAPQDPYAMSKWEAEQGLFDLSRATGLEITVIRPPLVYGPGVGANFLSLLKLTKSRIPLPLGAVSNKRSFIFVGNLADVIVASAFSQKAAGETFLVSDGQDLSVAELIRKLSQKMQRQPRLISIPPRLLWLGARMFGKNAAAQRLLGSLQLDISHTRDILGWSPPYALDEALSRTVTSFLERN